jgi:hypothetical protein
VSWRDFPVILGSGLTLRTEFADYDARKLYEDELRAVVCSDYKEPEGCRCGEILRGLVDPDECPLFSVRRARLSILLVPAWSHEKGVATLCFDTVRYNMSVVGLSRTTRDSTPERRHFRKKFIGTMSSPKERTDETVFVAFWKYRDSQGQHHFFGCSRRYYAVPNPLP